MRTTRRHEALALALALTLAAALYTVATRRVQGDVFNSYPLVLMDGFDWLFEGHAVAALLAGHAHGDLPLLRNPLYVLVIAADAAAGAAGRLLFAAHALAFLAQVVLLLRLCALLGGPAWLRIGLPVLLALSAVGGYRLAIFPDDLAIAFALGALLALLEWRRSGRARWLLGLALTSVLGALTQEYAALPLVVGTLFETAAAWRARRRVPLALLAILAASGGAYLALGHAWSVRFPHGAERDVWAPFVGGPYTLPGAAGASALMLLRVFWPLGGLLVAALTRPRHREAPPPQGAALVLSITGLWVLLILAYRWPDPRHAYQLVPWCLLVVAAGGAAPGDRRPGWARLIGSPALAVILWLLQGLGVVHPFDAWVRANARAPVTAALALPPLDRFQLASRCGSPGRYCPDAARLEIEGTYPQVIACEYRALRIDGVLGTCGSLAGVTNFSVRRPP